MAQVEVFARTEVGCVRKRNEDHFVVANLATRELGLQPGARVQPLGMGGTLIAVCDGMGGAAAGDLASSIAGDTLAQLLQERSPFADMDAAQKAMLAAVTAVNNAMPGAEKVTCVVTCLKPLKQPGQGAFMIQRARRQCSGQCALFIARGESGS